MKTDSEIRQMIEYLQTITPKDSFYAYLKSGNINALQWVLGEETKSNLDKGTIFETNNSTPLEVQEN